MLAACLGACSQTNATAQAVIAAGSISDLFSYLSASEKSPSFAANLAKSGALPSSDYIEQMFVSVTDAPGEFAGKSYINLKKKITAREPQLTMINTDALAASVSTLVKSSGALDRAAAQAYVDVANQGSDLLAGRPSTAALATFDNVKKALHVSLALIAVQGFDCAQVHSSAKGAETTCYRDANAQVGFYLLANGQSYIKNDASTVATPEAVAKAAAIRGRATPAQSSGRDGAAPGIDQTIQPASEAALREPKLSLNGEPEFDAN